MREFYDLKVDLESADAFAKMYLEDSLQNVEEDNPTHPDDIAWQKEYTEALRIVLKYV